MCLSRVWVLALMATVLLGCCMHFAYASPAAEEEDSDVDYSSSHTRPPPKINRKPQNKQNNQNNQNKNNLGNEMNSEDEMEGVVGGKTARKFVQRPRAGEEDDDLGKIEDAVPKEARIPMVRRYEAQEHFYVEICAVVWILIAVVFYFWGKSQNVKLANRWFTKHHPILTSNFALVGDDGNFEKEFPKIPAVLQQSANHFSIYCSGRKHCRSCLIAFDLCARQDLLAIFYNIATGADDLVELTFEFDQRDVGANFCLAVLPTRGHIRYQKSFEDLAHIKSRGGGFKNILPQQLAVLTDSDSATTTILSGKVAESLLECSSIFRSLHITDSNPFPEVRSKHVMKMQFVLPGTHTEESTKLLETALLIVDKLASVKASDRVKRTVEPAAKETAQNTQSSAPPKSKKEKEAELEKIRAEEARLAAAERKKKREALERAKLEERMVNLPPEERRKIENKIAKEDLRKRQKSMKNKVQFMAM